MRFCTVALLLAASPACANGPLFTEAERAQCLAYWNAPGRYRVSLPLEAARTGPWKVGLTVGGSTWFLAYQRAVGAAKLPPTQDATATSPDTAGWEAWVQARLDYDRWKARAAADAANAALRPSEPVAALPPPPPLPGPIPAALRTAAGNPPPLAEAVAPRLYTVAFDDGENYAYTDNLLFANRPRFAYFRSAQGAIALGPRLRDLPVAEQDALFADAGLTPSEQRIARAVSALEGGFESINTYDTGSISVGFIQFVTMADGRHSLLEVMARQKADWPADFAKTFRRFGMEVSEEGVLVVVDPDTGAELTGPEAVQRVIEDKRLTAVFQRAGRRSRAFRIAQVQVAKSHYWPADDPVTVTINGQTVTGRVSDVIRSEAGMATLFDRKVNRGTIAPFAEALAKVMAAHGLSALSDASAFEREIVAAMKYRADFLADASLSQPAGDAAPN